LGQKKEKKEKLIKIEPSIQIHKNLVSRIIVLLKKQEEGEDPNTRICGLII
jgi:hypothetical protein